MKLFKKRDTVSNPSTSPASSLGKASLQQSPLAQTTSAQESAHSSGLATKGSHGARDGPQFPWSSQRLSNNNPFPRYGHATNSQAGKSGDIYIFGGLLREQAMNDLWHLSALELQAQPVSTTGDQPSPRVGHAALLVGNAFIVFGGDTKLNGNDANPNNDDSLYLLNTTTKVWTVARVAGAKPSGRYGHTLSMLGPKVLVFGGQVEGFFFNDLVAFDLNTLNHAVPRWELISPIEGNDPPPSRTNHVAVTYKDKLYIFGGTNGIEWFNDMWCFDPIVRTWTMLKCSGFVPQPREGHSAALVGDVIYVFGGRDVDSNDLGDLSAFKITTARWFTFQNMGPGPSPRSGHALCSVGKKVYVVGGEGASSRGDEQNAHILDTTKIRYPVEGRAAHKRSESLSNEPKMQSNDGSPTPRQIPQDARQMGQPTIRSVSGQGTTTASRLPQSSGQRTQSLRPYETRNIGSPSQAYRQRNVSLPNQNTRIEAPRYGPARESTGRLVQRSGSLDSMMELSENATNAHPDKATGINDADALNRTRLNRVRSLEEMKRDSGVSKSSHIDEVLAPALRHADSGQQPTLATVGMVQKRSTQRHSTTSDQLEVNNKMAWLQAEIQLARQGGYVPSSSEYALDSLSSQESTKTTEALLSAHRTLQDFREELKSAKSNATEQISLAQAEREIALRELTYEKAKSQALLDSDTERLRIIEVQRTQEFEEELVACMRHQSVLEHQMTALQSNLSSTKRIRDDHDALLALHEKTAQEAVQKHSDLLFEHDTLRSAHSEAQKQLEEHQRKLIETESVLSTRSIDIEKLKDLEARHTNHLQALEAVNLATSAATARASNAERMLNEEQQVTTDLRSQIADLTSQLQASKADLAHQLSQKEQTEKLLLHVQGESDAAKKALLNGMDELVRQGREVGPHDPVHHASALNVLQDELTKTRQLHDSARSMADGHLKQVENAQARIATLEAKNQSDSQQMLAMQRQVVNSQVELQELHAKHLDLTEQHAKAREELDVAALKYSTLQQIVRSKPTRRDSIEKRRSRNLASPISSNGRASHTPDASRLRELETRLVESAQLQREMQDSHRKATAEIEALSTRHEESIARQQEAEHRARNLEERLASSSLDTDADTPGEAQRSDSVLRNHNKETQLAQARAADAERQLTETTQNFKERLSQLEADYQSAVHYVKGTEKMLRRMKEELGKYKTANAKLQGQIDAGQLTSGDRRLTQADNNASDDINSNRSVLNEELSALKSQLDVSTAAYAKKIASLESQLAILRAVPNKTRSDGKRAKQLEDDLEEATLSTQKLQFENRELEKRMQESEAKVKLLLDQFENSVDTYRRQSMALSGSSTEEHRRMNSGSQDEEVLAPPLAHAQMRTSSALDNLANELDQLRNHWEVGQRQSNYRPSESEPGTLDEDTLTNDHDEYEH